MFAGTVSHDHADSAEGAVPLLRNEHTWHCPARVPHRCYRFIVHVRQLGRVGSKRRQVELFWPRRPPRTRPGVTLDEHVSQRQLVRLHNIELILAWCERHRPWHRTRIHARACCRTAPAAWSFIILCRAVRPSFDALCWRLQSLSKFITNPRTKPQTSAYPGFAMSQDSPSLMPSRISHVQSLFHERRKCLGLASRRGLRRLRKGLGTSGGTRMLATKPVPPATRLLDTDLSGDLGAQSLSVACKVQQALHQDIPAAHSLVNSPLH